MTTAVATTSAAARTTSPAPTSAAATTARPTASAAISTPVWTIPGSTFSSSTPGYARDRIAIEVRLVVGEISPAFDGQRRRSSSLAVALLAAVRSRLATTHLRPLLFEDGLAR